MSTITKTNFGQITPEQLFQMLGFNAWGVGGMHWDVTSQMEKDENLEEMIRFTRFAYAQWLKMACDVKKSD